MVFFLLKILFQVETCQRKVSEKCHTEYEKRCETYAGKEL